MPLEQLNTAIVFKCFYVASKVGKTGLADVTVDVRNPAGTEIVTGAAATEVGDGFYTYTLVAGSVTTEGEYLCVFKSADATVDQQHLPSLWVVGRAGVENLDAAVSSRSSHAAADIWTVATRALTDKAGFSLSAAGIQAVWDALTSALTTVGSIGKLLVDRIDAAISSRLATSGYTTPPTAAAVADQVWDEAIADHVAAGSTGDALDGLEADLLGTTVPGSFAAGTAGYALGRIGSGTIAASSPVATTNDVSIVRGDDYSNDDARALEWSTSDSATWPTLTGATITFTARPTPPHSTAAALSKAGTVITGTGANKKVRVELTNTDTAGLMVGTNSYSYDVQATLATNSRRITLVRGNLTVLADQTYS